ncbi:hypothetical protein Ciccas_001416 [Cichlidogyrus casuarinus]|uniref:Uncharacterized protein n=1 Tax=Cichlidogyrus casuarinus TaxID=1844966 RepID=A0ABD2QK23_9PLAT
MLAAMQYMYSMSSTAPTPSKSTPSKSSSASTSSAAQKPTPAQTSEQEQQLTAALYANLMQQQLAALVTQAGSTDNLSQQEQQQLAAMLQLIASASMEPAKSESKSRPKDSGLDALNLSIPSTSAAAAPEKQTPSEEANS